MVITRADYLANIHLQNEEERFNSYRAYIGQFVTPDTINYVVNAIGRKRLMSSTDRHLNDIPLDTFDWIAPGLPLNRAALREAGDAASLGTLVCIAKEAARQYIESQT